MWRALISSVPKAMAATGAGVTHCSIAANWAPPAKTVADMSGTSAGESPFEVATAPKSKAMGMAARAGAEISARPARISERRGKKDLRLTVLGCRAAGLALANRLAAWLG